MSGRDADGARIAQDRAWADSVRDHVDAGARDLGHTLAWELGPCALVPGHAYHWVGVCGDCGATASASAGSSSCPGVRDARHERCSGPGTALLTQIETDRVRELMAAAVVEFVAELLAGPDPTGE